MAASALLLLGFATAASAQEAVRMSMASAQAAEVRRRAATALGHYNLELGPTAWNFGAGLGLDYNDNVIYTDSNPESDFIVRPQINTRMLWPISDRNSIDLSVGAGYSAYVQHSELSRYFITPDSELSFDLYAGDFIINLHDRVSITENTYQDPGAAGTGDYSQFQNTLGVSTLWDLNKAVLRFGFDHQYHTLLSGTQDQSDGQAETIFSSVGYAPKPGVVYGVELGGAQLQYSGHSSLYSDASQWNVGGFYDSQVSEYVHFKGSGGYTLYTPNSSQTNRTDFSGFYVQLALTHRVNQYMEYSLSGSRTIETILQGGTTDMYSLSWQANWRVIRKTSLSTAFVYNHGSQVSFAGETFDQYGPQIRLGWRLSDKLSSSVGYQFYQRNSNESGRGYSVNVVSFDLKYTF